MIKGFATADGTLEYAQKHSDTKEFFIKHNGVVFSKLGLGTFNKEPYKEENYLFNYVDSIKSALQNGINFIDTAINYRYQQSEKEIGYILGEMIKNDEIKRENIIIASKGGFIPLEYPFPDNPYHWIRDNMLLPKLCTEADIELDQHCISEKFLEYSLNKSLENLGLETIDIYFLHNPEIQLGTKTKEDLLESIKKAFEVFEKAVNDGKIKSYGVATWNGFINDQGFIEYLSLGDIYDVAVSVAGDNHHFKYIQVPFNLAKTHIYTMPTQSHEDEDYTVVELAHKLGLGVISSSSLLQMNLFKKSFNANVGYILDKDMQLTSDIQLALQFVRSTPNILSSLFASKNPEHVLHNLEISKIKATPKKLYDLMYKV